MLVLSEQQFETPKYLIHSNVQQGKTANPDISEGGTINFLAFWLEKLTLKIQQLFISAPSFILLGWMFILCVITDVKVICNEVSLLVE